MMFGLPDSLQWQRDAACLEHPREWWFPDRTTQLGYRARAVCEGCLVRAECLAFALSGNEDHGIWGGFTTREIDRMKRRRCTRCDRKPTPQQVAALAIAGADLRNWKCRQCFYREIQARKRV